MLIVEELGDQIDLDQLSIVMQFSFESTVEKGVHLLVLEHFKIFEDEGVV